VTIHIKTTLHTNPPDPTRARSGWRDGVTTSMDLQAGVFGPRVDDWYKMHEGRIQGNYGTASGHEFARPKTAKH
jgi:N-acyl-D-glutamate deacylase/dihydroorotase